MQFYLNNDNSDTLTVCSIQAWFNHNVTIFISAIHCALIFQTLCLRQNLIKKIENLDRNVNLMELDLYDNQITKIENLDTLVNLE